LRISNGRLNLVRSLAVFIFVENHGRRSNEDGVTAHPGRWHGPAAWLGGSIGAVA
jgi:hypothetical protein